MQSFIKYIDEETIQKTRKLLKVVNQIIGSLEKAKIGIEKIIKFFVHWLGLQA